MSMAVSLPVRSTRLLVYSHDAFGLGNMRRTLKICDQLAKEIPGSLHPAADRLADGAVVPPVAQDGLRQVAVRAAPGAQQVRVEVPADVVPRDQRACARNSSMPPSRASGRTSCWSTRCPIGHQGRTAAQHRVAEERRSRPRRSSWACATSSTTRSTCASSGRARTSTTRSSKLLRLDLGVRLAQDLRHGGRIRLPARASPAS